MVPPNQSEMMRDALREKGVPVAYLPFEGEQHGFRRAENIKRTLDAELYFYSARLRYSSTSPTRWLKRMAAGRIHREPGPRQGRRSA